MGMQKEKINKEQYMMIMITRAESSITVKTKTRR